MSSISLIHDSLNTRLAALYGATHKELADPFILENNDDKSLARGYAWYLGSGDNTDLQVGCNSSTRRQIVFVLTIANRGTDRDISIRRSAEKAIFEDLFILTSNIETGPNLEDSVATFRYISDTGLEPVYTDNTFLSIRCVFEMHYIEEL
jgi:hypothetical protein